MNLPDSTPPRLGSTAKAFSVFLHISARDASIKESFWRNTCLTARYQEPQYLYTIMLSKYQLKTYLIVISANAATKLKAL
jgi:hypothetical protein